MTRNRTGVDLFSVLGNEVLVLLLVVLAVGLTVSNYVSIARERMRHLDMRHRRRAARQSAA